MDKILKTLTESEAAIDERKQTLQKNVKRDEAIFIVVITVWFLAVLF
jgi:hypothetical protein